MRIAASLTLLLLVAGCFSATDSSSQASEGKNRVRIVVYSPHGPEVLGDYEKKFEAAYPEADVQWLDLGSQEVYNRVRAEQRRPYADIWWGGPSSLFVQAAQEGLLEPYHPSWADVVPAEFRDTEDRWYGTYRSPLAIVFNNRKYTQETAPRTWDELLETPWQGKVALRKPQASGTMRTFLGAMILRAESEDEGIAWLKRLHACTAAYLENPQILFDHLKRREDHVTIWLLPDVVLQRERNGYPLDCVVPPDTVVLTEGIAIVRGAPNRTWAERFYEFVTSSDALVHQAHAYAKMPARTDVDPARLPEWMRSLNIQDMKIDWAYFAQHENRWCERWEKEVYRSP